MYLMRNMLRGKFMVKFRSTLCLSRECFLKSQGMVTYLLEKIKDTGSIIFLDLVLLNGSEI